MDENTLSDVKKYLEGNKMIASSAKSTRNSLSKGKQMLREVHYCISMIETSRMMTSGKWRWN